MEQLEGKEERRTCGYCLKVMSWPLVRAWSQKREWESGTPALLEGCWGCWKLKKWGWHFFVGKYLDKNKGLSKETSLPFYNWMQKKNKFKGPNGLLLFPMLLQSLSSLMPGGLIKSVTCSTVSPNSGASWTSPQSVKFNQQWMAGTLNLGFNPGKQQNLVSVALCWNSDLREVTWSTHQPHVKPRGLTALVRNWICQKRNECLRNAMQNAVHSCINSTMPSVRPILLMSISIYI